MTYIRCACTIIAATILFSCVATRNLFKKNQIMDMGSKGNLVIRLEPIVSVSTDASLGYVMFVSQEKNNNDVFAISKFDRTVRQIATTPFDEQEPAGIDDNRTVLISREYDVRGDVVIMTPKGTVILSDKGNACSMPSVSPDRKHLVYIQRKGNEYRPILYSLETGEKKNINLLDCTNPVFIDAHSFVYILGNSLFRYDILTDRSVLVTDSPSLKFHMTVDMSDSSIYYIAIPFDTNGDGVLNETDSRFITRLDNNRELYLFPVNEIKQFALDARYLYYIDRTIVKYQEKSSLVPEFSTIFHFASYIEKAETIDKKIIAYTYALEKFKNESRAEDLYRDYLSFLKKEHLDELLTREIATIRASYPKNSRIYYFADSIQKDIISPNKEFNDYYVELYLERLYEDARYPHYIQFYTKQKKLTHLPRRTYNKLYYWYGMSLAKTWQFDTARDAFVALIANTLMKDEWIDRAVDALINLSRTDTSGIASINYLERLKLQYPDSAIIYTKAAIEIAHNYIQLSDYETAEKELYDVYDRFGDEDLKDDITLELIALFIRQQKYEKIFDAAKNRIENEYLGLRYDDFLNHIEVYGTRAAEKYFMANDMLQAKKWYAAVLQFSPLHRTANRGLIDINFALGNILATAGQYRDAYQKSNGDPLSTYYYAYALTYVGTHFAQSGKYDHEKAAYEEAYALLMNAREKQPDEPFFYLTIGWVEEQFERLKMGNYLEAALEHYKTGLALSEDERVKGYFYKNLGNVYYQLKLNSLALHHYSEMEKRIPAYGNDREKIGYYLKLSDIYYQTDDYSKALELDTVILTYYETNTNKPGMVFVYKHMGLLYHQRQEYLKAADMFNRALRLVEAHALNDNITLLYRNIAYNALLGNDEDRAIEAAIKGLETVKADIAKKSGGLLSVSVDVALSAESSTAYKGLTGEMERDLFYTILARAYQIKGDFRNALRYYDEKKKRNIQPYAASIIANNLADMYHRIAAESEMDAYLRESLSISDKEKFLKGSIINELSVLYLKDDVNHADMLKLEKIKLDVIAVRDSALQSAYKLIFVYSVYKYCTIERRYVTLQEATDAMLFQAQLIAAAYGFIAELEQSMKPSEPVQRIRLLFDYMFYGKNIIQELVALSVHDTVGVFPLYDLALINLEQKRFTESVQYLDAVMTKLRMTNPFRFENGLYFWYYHREDLYSMVERIAEAHLYNDAFRLLIELENCDAYFNYILYKPVLSSQFDTVNIGNYLYAVSQNSLEEMVQYKNTLDDGARLLTGTLSYSLEDIQRILSASDALNCRLGRRYLTVTSTGVSLTDAATGLLHCDRSGASFSPTAYNAFSVSQMYVMYKKRMLHESSEVVASSDLLSKKGGSYSVNEPLIMQPVYPDSKLGSLTIRDLTAHGLTVDALELRADDIVALKPIVDILLYNGVAQVRTRDMTIGYRPMTDEEIAQYVSKTLVETDRKAIAYYQLGYYGRAFQELQKVVRFARLKNDPEYLSQRLLTLINIGSNLLNDPDLVKNYLEEYLKIKGDGTETAYYDRLAALYERNGYYKKAIELYEQGKVTKNDFKLAVLFEKYGDMKKALQLLAPLTTADAKLERSKIKFRFMNDFSGAQTELDSITDTRYDSAKQLYRAFIATNMGEFTTALTIFDTFEKGLDPKNALSINARIGRAQIYYEKSNYFKALKIASDVIKDIPEKSMFEERIVINNLRALCYIESGRLDAAAELLDIAEKDALEKNIVSQIPIVAINKAIIMRKRQEFDKALDELKKMEDYFKTRENVLVLAGIYRNIGITYYEKGDMNNARIYFTKISSMTGEETKKDLQVALYYNGLIDKNVAQLRQSLQLAEQFNNEKMLLKIHTALGVLLKDTAHLETAIRYINSIQEKIKIFDLRKSFFKENIAVYEELIQLYAEKNNPEKVFETIETVKLIGFSMTMNDDLAFMIHDVKISARIKEMKEKVEYLQYQAQNNADWQGEYTKAKTDYENYKVNLFIEHGDSLEYKPFDTPSAEQIRAMIGESIGISYYRLRDTLYAVYCTRMTMTVKTIALTHVDIDTAVTSFRDAIIEEKDEAVIRERGAKLYSLLLDHDTIKKFMHVIISPSDVLNYIPFGALYDGTAYLYDASRVTYVPGFNVLMHPNGVQKNAVFAIGNPDVNNESLELYFAQKEANEIAFMYGTQSAVLIGKEATESEVKRNINEKTYDTIHLACHGVFNQENPAFSFLYLREDEKNNGRLDIEEILGLKIHANLVVLSACETAVGSLGKGDEVMALDRAFLNAGSNAVISALWRISDVATAMLFKKYYRYRLSGVAPDEALHKASLDLRHYFPHPMYWAALKYTGR